MVTISKKVKYALCAALLAMTVAPVTSFAADKLVVKDAGGENTVFAVDDTGTATGNKLGMGTKTPRAPLHLNLGDAATGTLHPVGTLLYPATVGTLMSTQDNSLAFDLTVASQNMGYRGAIRGVKARGTLESPTAPMANDYLFSIMGSVWDGAAIQNTAMMSFLADGAVSPGVAPVRISIMSKTGGAGTWYERMTIKNDGKVGINNPNPSSIFHVSGLPVYEDNTEAITAGLTPGAFYRTSQGVLMVAF